MAEAKTKPTRESVESFLEKATDEKVRKDCYNLIALMEKITGEPATMWGTAIIGFGKYHYKYDSGREGEICITGFSPRKANLSLYGLAGFKEQDELLARLGKYKAGKGCLYIKKLEDIDINILESLIVKSVDHLKKRYRNN